MTMTMTKAMEGVGGTDNNQLKAAAEGQRRRRRRRRRLRQCWWRMVVGAAVRLTIEGKCHSEALFSLRNIKNTNSYDKFMDRRTDRKTQDLRSKKAEFQVRTHVGTQVRTLRQLPTSTLGQTPCPSEPAILRSADKKKSTATLILQSPVQLRL